ncbi:MAG: twin-arginine translocase TatA/TatE family subunit [Cyanobacteria bacterium HKST-UBA06]|nr:twin-arginine translocase TatA/TatE family subunit [Cyanobacteria bacterium HKST-UBA05]MCA9798809.1 twin-arginine translocase TatA/TatE family subunit [Cyanobacteria bacterium HKST-UBA04]MCA9807687.1 twin-arginine translocase TatA/TatE family subunit [Cyanobacteria bacterium HKST-UBA06]MCA9841451.1 twin-arginine translocase TatA/TatE family subunit [Cyanobacteria bacterium HKST-UBA03]
MILDVILHGRAPLLFFPSVGTTEIVLVFIVILILFGPGKLPEVFKAMGKGVRQFKDAAAGATDEGPPAINSPGAGATKTASQSGSAAVESEAKTPQSV